jgi:hypothetical protein
LAASEISAKMQHAIESDPFDAFRVTDAPVSGSAEAQPFSGIGPEGIRFNGWLKSLSGAGTSDLALAMVYGEAMAYLGTLSPEECKQGMLLLNSTAFGRRFANNEVKLEDTAQEPAAAAPTLNLSGLFGNEKPFSPSWTAGVVGTGGLFLAGSLGMVSPILAPVFAGAFVVTKLVAWTRGSGTDLKAISALRAQLSSSPQEEAPEEPSRFKKFWTKLSGSSTSVGAPAPATL